MKIENTYQNLWNRCLQIIENNVAPETFRAFFATMKFEQYSVAGRALLVQIPSSFVYEYVEEHFADMLHKVVCRVFNTDVVLRYRVCVSNDGKASMDVQPDEHPNIPTSNIKQNPQQGPSAMDAHSNDDIDSQLLPEYTMNNFIEGEANRAARAIGIAVADKPASRQFNPLFIYGPSGCGKTHLINAIGVRTKELYPRVKVLYVSARLFQQQFANATMKNQQNDFIAFYQRIDVLIVDDIQEWETAPKTQDAFFHIFNHLHRNGRRIILASDRPPVELKGINQRLITRFSGGPTLEIAKPDKELCKNILKAKTVRDGLEIPDDVLDYIAETANGSVRNLEGVISSLMAYSIVYNHPHVDMKLAERVVKRSVKVDDTPLTMDDIMDKVATVYGIEVEAITGKNRQKDIVEARMAVAFLTQKHTKMTVKRIGKLLGNRNHSTILHSCSQVEKRLAADPDFAHKITDIENSFSLKSAALL